MKLALTLAAGMLAASSFAVAADNSNNGDNKGQDKTTTGSTRNSTGDLTDQKACRDGTGGGAPCQEDGTVMEQQ